MPKRKSDETLNYIVKKLKFLEKEVKRSRRRSRQRRVSSSSSSDASSSRSSSSKSSRDLEKEYNDRALTEYGELPPAFTRNEEVPPQQQSPARAATPLQSHSQPEPTQCQFMSPQPSTSRDATAGLPQQPPTMGEAVMKQTEHLEMDNPTGAGLNSAILEILGIDPTTIVEHGPPINTELANRLTHVVTSGLKREERKDISIKYLVPENCQAITAPIMNAEIKAALAEGMLKRDKALESRQKCVATVISCLSKAITTQINSTEPDHEIIQHLMDATRLLCDIQYNDSTSRKMFALSTLKKELKDQLAQTKIGKQLFGENLGETLKTAKAVSKSGAELKEPAKKPNNLTARNLNWKTTGGPRRQAAVPSSSRRQPPLAPSTAASTYQHQQHRQPPPPPPGNFSSASAYRPRQNNRRR